MATVERCDASRNATRDQIDVEVVYARPDTIWRCELRLVAGSSVLDGIMLSGFFKQFPDYSSDTIQAGIYGQKCALSRLLDTGDRVEIYRPLVFDPMESRRRRARHRLRA